MEKFTTTEEKLLCTIIEYLKEIEPQNDLISLFRRSTARYEYTSQYIGWNIPHQRKANIELRVPLPLLKEAEKNKKDIDRIFEKCCERNDSYGFGTTIIRPKLLESSEIDYKEYDVCFVQIEQEIIGAIQDAKYLIWVAVAWFTSARILEELKKRKEDGLNIRIITSEEYSNRYLIGEMADEFEVIPIKKQGTHRLHDKFCIIDLEYVMHGSYNWSENAKNNDEAWSWALDRELVKKFANEFIKLHNKKDPNEDWRKYF